MTASLKHFLDLDQLPPDTLRSILGVEASADAVERLRACWAEAFEPDPAVLRLIQRCPARTALFTNNGPLLEAALQSELSDVGEAFGELLFSWRLGAAKPDAEAFARATEALRVEPSQVLFVDDSEPNVEVATAHGWQAHRFTTALDLQATLAGHGLGG